MNLLSFKGREHFGYRHHRRSEYPVLASNYPATLILIFMKYITVCLLAFTVSAMDAQPGSVDLSFNPGSGPNAPVEVAAIQPDQKVVIGGSFTSYNGTTIYRIARLNTDGSLDMTFGIGNGFNGTVRAIAIQNDGKILVGGDFGGYDNTPGVSLRFRIARLNSNGTLDGTFSASTTDLTGAVAVYSIAVQSDGKILIGGTFNKAIRRLNPATGSTDNTFAIGAGYTGSTPNVRSIVVQPDGKILVGGEYTTFNGFAANRMSRILATGASLDGTFLTGGGIGPNGTVNALALRPDGRVIVAGIFNQYNGFPLNGVGQLSSTGVLDGAFPPPLAMQSSQACLVQPDGIVVAGGANQPRRLDATGSIVGSFLPSFLSGGSPLIKGMVRYNDGDLFFAGRYISVNGVNRNCVARINGQ